MQVHRDGHDQLAVPHRSAWRDGFERTVPAWATCGEFKYRSYVYRATCFTATTSAAGTRSSQSIKPTGITSNGEQSGKAA
jgi:hypothetical protein